MRCAIYCRLSREDEQKHGESESIVNQRSMLTGYAREHGWDIYKVYSDEDMSGADARRPGFNEMLRDAREGEFSIILCKTQSRFTRDMELVEKYLHKLFPLWGIRFIAPADGIDTDQRGNKKARQINGLVNEWYLEDLSENVRMVLDHKRRRGIYIGSFALYGYRKSHTERGRLEIDPAAAQVVRKIFSLASKGRSCARIAAILNRARVPNPTMYKSMNGEKYINREAVRSSGWSRSTVSRMLRNEMYTGVMVQGRSRKISYKSGAMMKVAPSEWFRVENTHEAIIPQELFEAVQRQSSRYTRSGDISPFGQ